MQETLAKALEHSHLFKKGTNLKGWLFTILRNTFLNEIRSKNREVEDVDGRFSGTVSVPPRQSGILELGRVQRALSSMPKFQRDALLLVGVSGYTNAEAAEICKVPIYTLNCRCGSRAQTIGKVDPHQFGRTALSNSSEQPAAKFSLDRSLRSRQKERNKPLNLV